MQSVRTFSAFIHYTDWVPAHIHMGTMGWVSMIAFASIFYLVPRIYGRQLYSVITSYSIHYTKLYDLHFQTDQLRQFALDLLGDAVGTGKVLCHLQGAGHFDDLEHFEEIAHFQIVETLQRQTALEVGLHFLDVILEALQGIQFSYNFV